MGMYSIYNNIWCCECVVGRSQAWENGGVVSKTKAERKPQTQDACSFPPQIEHNAIVPPILEPKNKPPRVSIDLSSVAETVEQLIHIILLDLLDVQFPRQTAVFHAMHAARNLVRFLRLEYESVLFVLRVSQRRSENV